MRWIIPLLAGLVVVGFAFDAQAIDVTCTDGPAACTVSNDPFQWIECTCDGEPGVGGTGGSDNPWEGLSEQELLVECQELLPEACPAGDTEGSGGEPTDGSGSTDPTDPAGSGNDSMGDTDSGVESEGGPTDPDDGDSKKGCSVVPQSPASAAWLIALLGLRRRRSARFAKR